MTGPDTATRYVVADRASGLCEVCRRPAEVIHHRRLRGLGGSSVEWINDPANLLALDVKCHRHVHAFPTESYDKGLLVPYAKHPAEIPADIWRGPTFLGRIYRRAAA